MNTLFTSKEQVLSSYPDILKVLVDFPGPPYHIQVNPNGTLKQTLCRPVPVHLKEAFKKKVDKMLKTGIIKQFKKLLPGQIASCLLKAKTN